MEKNPVYEFGSYNAKYSISDSRTNVLKPANIARSKQATRCKTSCSTCVTATFAVVAVVLALLVLAGVVVTMTLRSQDANIESNTKIKQEMKKFMSQQMNVTNELTKLIQIQQREIESLKHNLQHSNESIIELRIQLASEIDTLSNNVTAGIATVQLQQSQSVIRCMEKTNEKYENLTEVIQHSLVKLTRKQEEDISSLEKSSNQSVENLHIQLHSFNHSFTTDIEGVWRRLNQNALDCLGKINETQNEGNNEVEAINNRIDHLALNFTSDVMLIRTQLSNIHNSTGSQDGPLTCEVLSPPTNGGVSIEAGPNSLSGGLGSVATYTCDPGYAVAGQRTRACEDTNGGTVTMGTWSGAQPSCAETFCLEPPTPVNGDAVLSSQDLSVGTMATYSCDSGYVLVGLVTRTCEDVRGETIGIWSGTTPACEVIIRCQQLTHPTNGEVSVSTGTHGVNLGVRAVATYSCSNGYGLVGQATRTCVSDGGSSGIWSGSQPTCEEVITCPSLAPPVNGVLTFTPGADNSNIGLGSVATYSCNLGYMLVGPSTRVCLTANGGAWSGNEPACEDAVYCPSLTAPDNGSVTIISGVNPLSVGSVATYSCDPGYILLGPPTRTCEDPDSDLVGTWTGTMRECQVILCPEIMAPVNGTLVISTPSPTQPLGVGTTATYSCDTGYVLVGDLTRTCEDSGTGTVGTWSGSEVDPICFIPNRALVDCENTTCRYEQLVCPDRDNCTINCNDMRSYACFRTGVVCPSVLGDCNLNCDDSYACIQANTTCPQGNCNVNCPSDYSCQNSVVQCSGDNCLHSCDGQQSCSHSVMQCSGNSCLQSCDGRGSCSYAMTECFNGNCNLHCTDRESCQYATMTCSANAFCNVNCGNGYQTCRSSDFVCEQGSTCVFNFDGGYTGHQIGQYTDITCEENSTCSIRCTGLSNSASDQCHDTDIICPTSSGECTVECSGYYSCLYSRITCGPNSDCLTCSGELSCRSSTITLRAGTDAPIMKCTGLSSCQHSRITCPANNNCTINCNAQNSCQSSTITCPANNDCTMNCNAPNSCQSSTIICPANSNCTINCDGQFSCNNARVTCPTGDYSCNIRCTDPLSCQDLSITNTHNVNLLCCGGPTACAGTSVVPTSIDCPYIN